ncbi:hypothetical protein RFI_04775, partial [Reticulomyxa filosa]
NGFEVSKLKVFGPELSIEQRVPSANEEQLKILEEKKEKELQKEELSEMVGKLQVNDRVETAAGTNRFILIIIYHLSFITYNFVLFISNEQMT